MTTPALDSTFTLPSGQVLKNRIGKSAMSEALATTDNVPTRLLSTLYRRWAEGGLGLCITGNVMIDKNALGEPNNVVLENDRHLDKFKEWAKAGVHNGTQFWMQLNHPGRQCPKGLNRETVSPSAVPWEENMQPFFEVPRELAEDEIQGIIIRFAQSASLAKEAGFTGVQIHGAHGYLVSQFLSPHLNRRTDQWGGTPENRMRFVKEVYRSIRTAVGSDFPIGIKMNSADFQKGGFSEEESLNVMKVLSGLGIDLIEISGGTYEAPAMSGNEKFEDSYQKDSTKTREAYFLRFAEKVRNEVAAPLMVTGGFRSGAGMSAALETNSLDIVGIARPMAIDPEFPNKVLNDINTESPVKLVRTGIKVIDQMSLMDIAWYTRQLKRIGKGLEPAINENPTIALIKIMISTGFRTFQTKRLRA
jgi:2,4-dienoyl-CoA reductase-like NADH-dependent reductase (Old Yellow Enzyme family)